MIGKPEWFKYMTFGWGVAPKTWQGWTYVAGVALILGLATAATVNNAMQVYILGGIFAIIILDTLHIMTQLPKVSDERENLHQLMIERNCSFAAIATLTALALWQTYQNRTLLTQGSITGAPFETSILIVLGAMLLTKIASTAYVKLKM